MSLRRGRDDPADIDFEERRERAAQAADEHAELTAFDRADDDIPVRVVGFTVKPIRMWEVSCDRCPGSKTMVADGPDADVNILAWAQSHHRNYHREGPSDVG